MNDPAYIIRSEVCSRIYNYGYIYRENFEEAVLPLTDILRPDPEASARLIASDALGKLGNKRAIPALQRAQEHDEGKDWEGRSVKDAVIKAKKFLFVILISTTLRGESLECRQTQGALDGWNPQRFLAYF